MYCPRCGTPNTETTKFCRQCGLPLQPITGFVATGGTGPLATPPPVQHVQMPVQMPETAEMLSLKHKRILTMMTIPIIPIAMAIMLGDMDGLIAIPFMLIPVAFVWANFRYKTQLRRLQEEQVRQYLANQPPIPQPVPQPSFQPPQHPAPYQTPLPPPTNPLPNATPQRGSVTEDETKRFPNQHA